MTPTVNHPDFRRDYHSILTRSLNNLRGTRGSQWAPDEQSPVVLLGEDAILDASAYSLANPETHDLERWESWPGVISRIDQLAGPPEIITKPEWFYDPDGDVPDVAVLRYGKPLLLSEWNDEEYRSEVLRRVDERCERAREKRKGRALLGRVAILAQSISDTPSSELPIRTRNPRVKCRSTTLRIAYLLWLSLFRREHREARLAFEAGDQEAEFPFGTYWHALRYRVNCSAVGPPGVVRLA
ncbi:MAG: hypothetical protein AAF581_01940 [Planctomycetota bacterium]